MGGESRKGLTSSAAFSFTAASSHHCKTHGHAASMGLLLTCCCAAACTAVVHGNGAAEVVQGEQQAQNMARPIPGPQALAWSVPIVVGEM